MIPKAGSALRAIMAAVCLAPATVSGGSFSLDEAPAQPGEWGYRPAEDSTVNVTPPGFVWRPQKDNDLYELQIARDKGFTNLVYLAKDIDLPVHCPPETIAPGVYYWRYRAHRGGDASNWSKARRFTIADDSGRMPLPRRDDLLARLPQAHPRLFLRPEQLDEMRKLAQGELKPLYEKLVEECEKLLASPPPTEEPPQYPDGMKRGSDPWRKIWWGNRTYTTRALNGAATLAFTRLLDGNEAYGREARRILMECAKWDPKGATGYRYNDEAGMPYNYYFSRTYSFVYDLLSEEDKAICRKVAAVRGDEMYRHLYPRHLWKPYASHSNRAWHFLGELGMAFLGEVEGADRWVWFAANVFANVYPVWCDDDGGWHEGTAYWSSYQGRFTWWADVMRAALGINAYDKPYYSSVGYYPMYLMPPGKVGGGFGDLTARVSAARLRNLVGTFATQAQNGHWQWWVEANGGAEPAGGYIGFVRGALPNVDPIPPDDLPASRLFRGTGQAYLNTTLMNADENVQVVFKSSPFGTQSHGYEANNSFLIHAWNKRLLIRSGRRDFYGSDHHRNWMWSTRSVNNITVNGEGQRKRTVEAPGRVVGFATTPSLDIVAGEAGQAYGKVVSRDERDRETYEPILDRFTRTIVFAKPDLVVVFDRLEAKAPSTFEYWLHAIDQFRVDGQHAIAAELEGVRCDIDFLAPQGLAFSQTDQYDPNPRPRIKLREWHLTGVTPGKRSEVAFVTLYRLGKGPRPEAPLESSLEALDGGYLLEAEVAEGKLTALLPTRDDAALSGGGLSARGVVKARLDLGGKETEVECPQK